MPIKQLIASKLGQLGKGAETLVKGAVRPVVNSFKKEATIQRNQDNRYRQEAEDARMGKYTGSKLK